MFHAARNGTKAKVGKLRFFGHVIRRKGLARTIITGKGNRKRKRGCPPNIMAQGHQELYRDDTAIGCESSRGAGEMAKNREKPQHRTTRHLTEE